jgi:UDP-glucose 4-epimerase
MRMLITGGAGFLGSHLAEQLLKRGHEVTVVDMTTNKKESKIGHLLDEKNFKFYRGSVLDKDLMDKLIWECDKVFHFAAIVGVHHYVERPYDVLDVNINGTKLVADLAFKYGKKMIFASTSEIYGRSTKIPFSEDDDRVLGSTKIDRWSYSTAKAAGEHYCFAYYQMGLPVVVLRFFNAYGPRLDSIEAGRIISIFMGQLLKGKPLTVIGDGSQTRCYTYVDDIVDGIIRSSEVKEAEGQVINLGTNRETSVLELAKAMMKLYGGNSEIQFIEHEGVYGTGYEDISRRVPDVSKSKKVLNWEAKISLEEGLRKTVDWFKQHYAAEAVKPQKVLS